jgi:hypothetical protein
MRQVYLLTVTAFLEVAAGLLSLAFPSVPLVLVLGVDQTSPEAVIFIRIAGAALLALGLACWAGRNGVDRPAQSGLLLGVLSYDVIVAGILAYTGAVLRLAGIVLWPAVALHAALAVWCVACLWGKPSGQQGRNP